MTHSHSDINALNNSKYDEGLKNFTQEINQIYLRSKLAKSSVRAKKEFNQQMRKVADEIISLNRKLFLELTDLKSSQTTVSDSNDPKKKVPESHTNLSNFSGQLKYFVEMNILNAKDATEATYLAEFWVGVLKNTVQSGAMDSAQAIYAAFESNLLKKTVRDNLSEVAKKILENSQVKILTEGTNHARTSLMMKSSTSNIIPSHATFKALLDKSGDAQKQEIENTILDFKNQQKPYHTQDTTSPWLQEVLLLPLLSESERLTKSSGLMKFKQPDFYKNPEKTVLQVNNATIDIDDAGLKEWMAVYNRREANLEKLKKIGEKVNDYGEHSSKYKIAFNLDKISMALTATHFNDDQRVSYLKLILDSIKTKNAEVESKVDNFFAEKVANIASSSNNSEQTNQAAKAIETLKSDTLQAIKVLKSNSNAVALVKKVYHSMNQYQLMKKDIEKSPSRTASDMGEKYLTQIILKDHSKGKARRLKVTLNKLMAKYPNLNHLNKEQLTSLVEKSVNQAFATKKTYLRGRIKIARFKHARSKIKKTRYINHYVEKIEKMQVRQLNLEKQNGHALHQRPDHANDANPAISDRQVTASIPNMVHTAPYNLVRNHFLHLNDSVEIVPTSGYGISIDADQLNEPSLSNNELRPERRRYMSFLAMESAPPKSLTSSMGTVDVSNYKLNRAIKDYVSAPLTSTYTISPAVMPQRIEIEQVRRLIEVSPPRKEHVNAANPIAQNKEFKSNDVRNKIRFFEGLAENKNQLRAQKKSVTDLNKNEGHPPRNKL